jgi:hypothetical protein
MILFRITDTLFWTVSLFLDYIGVFHVFSIKPSEKKTTNKTIKGSVASTKYNYKSLI